VRRAAVVAGILLAALAVAGPVAAADPITFGSPASSSAFGKSLEFVQPVTLAAAPARVELLLTTPGSAGPGVIDVPPPTGGGSQTLRFSIDLAEGHIYPNTTFVAHWRVTTADGQVVIGPERSHVYADDRENWRTVTGSVVRAHWYEGDNAFGRRILRIGDSAVTETAKLLGVTETEPIDFFVYADEDTFRGALGPAARENVGGEAHADIRTMFALITPADVGASWVETVVPHELTHLVFATAIDNPYHEPPHWLNEGLAVYLSESNAPLYRSSVEEAVRDDAIIPLSGLTGAFPTARERFLLAYGESVSAVDFIVRTYTRDALVGLIRSYAKGLSDDEAFTAAFGIDTAGLETAWLKDIGAKQPVRRGPQAAPVGPLPAGWAGPVVVPSVVPANPGAPGGSNPVTVTPGSPGPTGSGDAAPVVLLVGALAAAVVIGAVVLRGRRARAAPGPW
jgi:hypothetical protein